jgi:hypothetical protein
MKTILSQTDLDRANIQVAWSMAHKMTSDQYDQLCRVTVDQWRRESLEDPAVVLREACHG